MVLWRNEMENMKKENISKITMARVLWRGKNIFGIWVSCSNGQQKKATKSNEKQQKSNGKAMKSNEKATESNEKQRKSNKKQRKSHEKQSGVRKVRKWRKMTEKCTKAIQKPYKNEFLFVPRLLNPLE